ncbi:unnamed protein product, partial [Dicrocoelium dendriticum]
TILCYAVSTLCIAYAQTIHTYELTVTGYILVNGNDISWKDDMKDPNNAALLYSTEDICGRIKASIITLTGPLKDEVKCERTALFGHPVNGYLDMLFKKSGLSPSALAQDQLQQRLHTQFELITEQNKNSTGLVVGTIYNQWTTNDAGNDMG